MEKLEKDEWVKLPRQPKGKPFNGNQLGGEQLSGNLH